MNFSLKIAIRYLFSKKSTNAINIIAGISALGVFVSSAALIVILSVFNGFESIVIAAYHPFTPSLKIRPAQGKWAAVDSRTLAYIDSLPGVHCVVPVLEDKALLSYEGKQCIVSIKGMGSEYSKQIHDLDTAMVSGEAILEEDTLNYALLGHGVARALNMNVLQTFKPLTIYAPYIRKGSILGHDEDFIRKEIYPSGSFEVQQEYDFQYVLVPLRFAEKLFGHTGRYSSVEIYLEEDAAVPTLKKEIADCLGNDFVLADKYQQNELLYKILNSERWSVYLILSFVALIAICNIIGSLTMLIIDKRKDISILQALGLSEGRIRQIYLLEGIMIALLGCLSGLLVGGLFAYLQQRYGFIAAVTASDGTMINAYPVELRAKDFILVFATVVGIAIIASRLTIYYGFSRFGTIREDLNN